MNIVYNRLFFIALTLIATWVRGQELEWIKLVKASSIFELNLDSQNNIYLSGSSTTVANFGKEIEHNGAFVAKLNSTGNLLWFKSYPHNCRYLVDNQGIGYIVSTSFRKLNWQGVQVETKHNALFVVRANSEGNPLWVKAFEIANGLKNFKTALKGNHITVHIELEAELFYEGVEILPKQEKKSSALIELNESGEIVNIQVFDFDSDILSHPSVSYYYFDRHANLFVMGKAVNPLIHSQFFNPNSLDYLTKISPLGEVVWSSTLADNAQNASFLLTDWAENQQGFVVGGKFSGQIEMSGEKFGQKDQVQAFVGQFDPNGNLLWFKYGSSELNLYTSRLASSQNKIVAVGDFNFLAFFNRNRVSSNDSDKFLWNIPYDDPSQVWVMGNIKRLNNMDCGKPSPGLEGFRVQAQPGGKFASTDEMGNFRLRLPAGSYKLTQSIPNRFRALYQQYCPFDPSVSLQVEQNKPLINGANFTNIGRQTHFLRVYLSSNRRRRCFKNLTRVYYENSGNQAVENVEVVVELDKYTVALQSQPQWDIKNGNQIRYKIGRLEAGAKGLISISDSIVCGIEEIRGMIQCSRAEIFPENQPFFSSEELWDGSDLSISGFCINDKITSLSIVNRGWGGMADSTIYRLYLDDRLALSRKIKLAAGDSQAISVNASSATVRLEANNTPHNPNRRQISRTVLPCMDIELRTQSHESQVFNTDDENPRVSEECLAILDSYDPNDKLAQPRGWEQTNCITNDEVLRYKIRFQNTGSDTAYKVVVVDTLSQSFDLDRFEIGSASHHLKWEISGDGENQFLICTFDNIMLPDSLTDPVGSQGFVDFTIWLKPGLELGSQIKNSADIYFDFNSPIQTNFTCHTICQRQQPDSQLVSKVKTGHHIDSKIEMLCYPNPANEEFTVRVTRKGWAKPDPIELIIWDLAGRELKRVSLETNDLAEVIENKINISQYGAGIYLIELREGNVGKDFSKLLKVN